MLCSLLSKRHAHQLKILALDWIPVLCVHQEPPPHTETPGCCRGHQQAALHWDTNVVLDTIIMSGCEWFPPPSFALELPQFTVISCLLQVAQMAEGQQPPTLSPVHSLTTPVHLKWHLLLLLSPTSSPCPLVQA